jgi:hypothetical protein
MASKIELAKEVLAKAIEAVPAVRYALGVAGIAAAAFIASLFFGLDLGKAFLAILAVLIFMTVLIVIAKIATVHEGLLYPAKVLTWSYVIFAIAIPLFLITSVFFCRPLNLTNWVTNAPPPTCANGPTSCSGLTIDQVAALFLGGASPQLRAAYHQTAESQTLALAFQHLPITGDRRSTSQLVVDLYRTAFIQGKKGLLKVQRFAIPDGGRYVRGRSRGVLNGPNFVADTWAFALSKADEPIKLDQVVIDSKHAWALPQIPHIEFCLIAHYKNTVMFEQISGDFVGVELDDLGGRIKTARIYLGGLFSRVHFTNTYSVCPDGDDAGKAVVLEPLALTSDLSVPTNDKLRVEFDECISAATTAGGGDQGLNDALTIWNDGRAPNSKWTACETREVVRDLILVATGVP